jgi:hypothetical protein
VRLAGAAESDDADAQHQARRGVRRRIRDAAARSAPPGA